MITNGGKAAPSICLSRIDDFRPRSSVRALKMTIKLSLEIKRSLGRRSHRCAEATALYLKNDDLELKPQSLSGPLTRPAFGTGIRLFPLWEGERDQTSGCHGNWRKEPQSYRSSGTLTFITFNSIFSITPSPSPILLFFLSHFFPLILFVSSPHQDSHCHPSGGHHARSLCRRYPWHLREIKSLPMTDDHWSKRGMRTSL